MYGPVVVVAHCPQESARRDRDLVGLAQAVGRAVRRGMNGRRDVGFIFLCI